MVIRLQLLGSGQHFADYFILFPKKLQRLLNTLQTIVKAKDQFNSSHCILALNEVINSIYIDPRHSLENIQLFASVRYSLLGIFLTDI